MSADDIDADMRAAVEDRLAARIAEAKARSASRRNRLAELAERRRHGMAARHAAKLDRINNRTDQED